MTVSPFVIAPELVTRRLFGVGGDEEFITKLKVVVLVVKKSGGPVTVMGKVPVGVLTDVEMVRVELQVVLGVQDVGEKLAVDWDGRPPADKEIFCSTPPVNDTVMVLLPEPPVFTVMLPLLERE